MFPVIAPRNRHSGNKLDVQLHVHTYSQLWLLKKTRDFGVFFCALFRIAAKKKKKKRMVQNSTFNEEIYKHIEHKRNWVFGNFNGSLVRSFWKLNSTTKRISQLFFTFILDKKCHARQLFEFSFCLHLWIVGEFLSWQKKLSKFHPFWSFLFSSECLFWGRTASARWATLISRVAVVVCSHWTV